MEKDNWGIKRICLNCNTRFYDFNKPTIICPACNTVFDIEHLLRKKAKSLVRKDDAENIEIEAIDDIIIDDSDEDIDELEEATDDISLDDAKV